MYHTKHTTLTDDVEVDLFSVPTGYYCYITYVFAANNSGGAANTIDVKWTDDPDPGPYNDLMYIFDGTTVNNGDNITLGGQSEAPLFVLHSGEVVRVKAGQATGNMEVAVTFRLLENPNSFVNFNGS